MKKYVEFKRNHKESDILLGKAYNAFYKTGFMNEDVYLNEESRDIWNYMVKVLSDTNTASVFENILVAYEELEYSEAILQKITSRQYKDSVINDISFSNTYATTSPINIKFYRCLFMNNPSNFKNNKRIEIVNTISALQSDKYKNFTIIDSVVKFLKEQLTIHTEVKTKDLRKNLLCEDNIVTLVVPILEDGMYYNTNGTLRYPYLTEVYHHMKTFIGQLSFIFKSKVLKNPNDPKKGTKYIKRQSYFDVGEYIPCDSSEPINIFYVRLFNVYYNPLMFFEPSEVQKLLLEIDEDENVTDDIKEILFNTATCYFKEIDVVRKLHGNLVPSIVITKEDDSYFDEIKEKLIKLKEMEESKNEEDEDKNEIGVCECDDEDDEEYEDNTPSKNNDDEDDDDNQLDDELDDPYEIEPEEDEYATEIERLEAILKKREEFIEGNENKSSKIRLARHSLSYDKLKSLIMGYNGVKVFSYYPHLSDILLKYTDLNDVKLNSGVIENPKAYPKSFQIITTINNDELFTTNDSHNPLDWLFPFMYRKTIVHDAKTDGISKTKDVYIPKEERYLSEDEMGIIDPHTKKSDTAAGLLASINPFNNIKNRIKL